MLTHKQNKYVIRMYAMRHQGRYETEEEMRLLYEACLDISNHNFGATMRVLIKKLEDLEKIQNGLSPKVKQLLIDLKEDYDF